MLLREFDNEEDVLDGAKEDDAGPSHVAMTTCCGETLGERSWFGISGLGNKKRKDEAERLEYLDSAFEKRTQKTPPRELQLAQNRLRDWRTRGQRKQGWSYP